MWPPVALGTPLLVGLVGSAVVGDPFALPRGLRVLGWALTGAFALWNGWGLLLMVRHRTAVLPGGATRRILDRGPFRISRNPLYLGLTALDIGIALLWPSTWALLLVPVGVGLLAWGAIVPEERYLLAKFGNEYLAYTRRVRRWL
jgi:protein-S-isoprenylcysteine O-methyltransferase Ste14